MKVLVTGGAGFIGSHTVDALLKQGYAVKILDSLVPPVHLDGVVPDYVPRKDVELFVGDVRDKSAWERALPGCDAVFHLAAYQDYLTDFGTFFHVNTVGTALLYEVAVERRLSLRKVVVASSQATYGEAKYECRDPGCSGSTTTAGAVRFPPLRAESQLKQAEWEVRCPACGEFAQMVVTDEAVTNPHNQYAVSKYTQELVAFNLGRRYGIPTIAMRYSIVQGPRQSFRNAYSGILRIFSQRILHGRPAVCYEDGRQLRDYVSVHDVVRANLLVLGDPRAEYDVFNVGGDRQVTVQEYARLVAQRAGTSLEPTIPGIYRFGDTRHVVSDVTKLKRLGWTPDVSLVRVVDEYLDWAQGQPGFRDYSVDADSRMELLGTLRRVDQGVGV
jgi:dTDP-L-rhamnose 4-epimerase